MRVFADACIPLALVKSLREVIASSDEIVRLSEKFAPDIKDIDWIQAIAGEDWIVLSADVRIRKNPAELAAWKESRLTAFFLADGFASRKLMIQLHDLSGVWEEIRTAVRTCEPGCGFEIKAKQAKPRIFYDSAAITEQSPK